MTPVRVRFAPSPTGSFHIGSARTALFNWLYARHHNGVFVLRIEDTDRERNTPEALADLLDGLRWLGLDWDEGPEVGGDFGPYFQSERMHLYEAHLMRLREAGRAYDHEGAVFFRLEGERAVEHDAFLGKEVEKVKTRPVVFEDIIRGRMERAEERDFPIFRADGTPTFHFANVVDDITMRITHVIRGEDHLTNTSKHIELYHALEAEPPTYAHLPLILKDPSMGKGKMSKRDRGALISEYQERHFLPEALRNFIALLGWSPGDDREKMPIEEMVRAFRLERIQKGAARFDEKKLASLNTLYLHELPLDSLVPLVRSILSKEERINEAVPESYLRRVLGLAQEKIRNLESLTPLLGFFFGDDFEMDPKAEQRLLKKGDPKELVEAVMACLAGVDPWTAAGVDTALGALAERQGGKPFDYFPLLRFAVSGQGGGPDLLSTLEVLGRERVMERLRRLKEGLGQG